MSVKIFYAILGLSVGIITAPLAFVIWPVFLAWYLYNEADE